MKIIVLGGDGFCGWPTALRLLLSGHDVKILDNLSRRVIDHELNSNSLTVLKTLGERVGRANEYARASEMSYSLLDVTDAHSLQKSIREYQPDAIVHFAEQRAAPYSMISDKHRRYTIDNNVVGTSNLLSAIVEIDPSIHLIHLGTMGVYGYSKEFGAIPEGYLDMQVKSTGQDVSVLYPTNPGSVYHTSKSLDQILFQFYNKNWGLKITDLHQGIVWGTQTKETTVHEDLVNRFDYDGVYGTVLNRFITQAATGHPLTVYGTGGQRRAFIHISDTAECVKLAIENPPKDANRVRIFNQIAEVRGVLELANIIKEKYGAEVKLYDNPRKELAENELEVSNEGLRSLGFEPITLSDSLIEDCKFVADQFGDRLVPENIMSSPKW